MRNFTNDAVFDDTLPIADGVMESGLRVPLDLLQQRMEVWFRRKQYLAADEVLRVTELPRNNAHKAEEPWQLDANFLPSQPQEP